MVPSDPDFPYDIESLACVLSVPKTYPQSGKPALRILNQEMPRGFQLNVEQGFGDIAASAPNATLLGLMNRLDKDLAGLLSRPRAQTIKLYRNTNIAGSTTYAPSGPEDPPRTATVATTQKQSTSAPTHTFTSEQKIRAQSKRQADIRQLVARLGRLPAFNQAADGVTFTVPFTPPRKAGLPATLRNLSSVRLIVPELYNLEPCRVEFPGIKDQSATNVEQAFETRVRSDIEATLLTHINYMSQHLLVMSSSTTGGLSGSETCPAVPEMNSDTASHAAPNESKPEGISLPDRSHIHVIPRPPEWAFGTTGDEDSSSDYSSAYDTGDETDDEDNEQDKVEDASAHTPSSGPAEKGILLSFPGIELYGIELLELVSLSITVKCDRCKEVQDIERMRNNVNADHTGMKEVNCKKCANSIAAGYRMDLMHSNSARAGYLDLDGCTPVDMLPSTFVPTCSECSTSYTTPGCVSVRGESTLAICRECHRKMTFRIPETKFLTISAAAERATRATTGRRIKENLGIVAGQELPKRGRCTHYTKSHRWFR